MSLEAQLNAAIALHQAGQLKEAADLYVGIINADPAQHLACHLLALIAYQQGEHEAATALWEQAVAGMPTDPIYRNNCGEVLRQLGRNERAEAHFSDAVELKPDFAEAHNNLGLVLLNRKAYAEAKNCFETAIGLKPDFFQAHNNLGSVLKVSGGHAESFSHFSRAIELQPAYAEAWVNLGLVNHETRRYDEAEAAFRTAIQFAPGLVDAHIDLARLLYQRERFAEALEVNAHALTLKPIRSQQLQLHKGMGEANRALGHFSASRQAFSKALALDPESLQIRANAELSFTEAAATDYYSLGTVPPKAMQGIRKVALFAPGDHYLNMLWGLKRAFEQQGMQCVIGWPLLEPLALQCFIAEFAPDLLIEVNRTRHQAKVIPAYIKHVAWIQDGTLAFNQDPSHFGGSDRTYFMAQPEAVGYDPILLERDEHYGFLLPAADPAVYCPQVNAQHEYDFSFAGFIPPPPETSMAPTVLLKKGKAWTLAWQELEKLLRAAGVFQWSIGDCAYPMIHVRLAEHLALKPSELSIPDAAYPNITALMRLMDRKDLLDQALNVSDSLLINGPDTWLQWPRFAPHHKGMLYDARALADSYRSSRIVLHNGVSALHPRTFECLACGSALLINRCYTDDKPGSIHNYLTAGEHYIEYTLPEARETLREALADPARLKRIRAATQAQVLAKHTWDHRVRQLLAEL